MRAQDLNNYYMFQITLDGINPHRRLVVPAIGDIKKQDSSSTQVIQPIQYIQGWQTKDHVPEFNSVPISPPLYGWFEVKIIVKGQSIKLYINGNLILDRHAFLQIPAGKVGFRNHSDEEAHIKDLRVMIH